jgi:hypothetical protein
MRLGSFRLTRRRAIRTMAGFIATFVLAGNVLAAAGLCAVKAPADTHPASHQTAQERAAPPCPQHVAERTDSGSTASSHHCPIDDPSAQTRTVDLPAAQPMAALPAAVLDWTDQALQPASVVLSDHPSGPRPLYARLQRLRL